MLSEWIHGLPKVFLNIGVGPNSVGNREAEVIAETWPNIRIVGLEPNIGLFITRRRNYPGEIYPWGLWSTSSIQKMFMTPSRGQSSVLPTIDKDKIFHEVFVSCTTLDSIDTAIQYPDDIFLWMDIEGAELEALKGGNKLLGSGRVKWIAVEVAHKPKRIGEPTEKELTEHLKQYNFIPSVRYEFGKNTHNVLYIRKKKSVK